MKVLVLMLVIVFVCAVLFASGVVSPRKSRGLQSAISKFSKRAEKKGQAKAGPLGDMTGEAFKKSRHAADQSSEKGREIHDEITPH